MYTLIRSVRIMPGKMVEATAWAKELAQDAERPLGTTATVHTSVFGDLNAMYWISTYSDLAAIEHALTALGQDTQWQAIAACGTAFQVPGTLHDRVLRSA